MAAATLVLVLLAGPLAGALVTGSSGRNEGDAGIPAMGIAPETAARLARTTNATVVPRLPGRGASSITLQFDIKLTLDVAEQQVLAAITLPGTT